MRAIAAGLSDVGKQRVHNEDRFILLPEFSVFVVADGMGGHQSGEVASRMAASSIASYFRNGTSDATAGARARPQATRERPQSTRERGAAHRGAPPDEDHPAGSV